MQKRHKKPKLPPSVTPHECVVLAVDTAQRSGWAVYVRGELVGSGEVDTLDPSKSTDQWGESGWMGDRVAQAVIVPVHQVAFVAVDELAPSARGASGWGSSGRQ